jgi:N-acetylneuraminic acid mutarotase
LAGVFGGVGSATNYLTTNEVYNYNTNTWATKAPMPTGRYNLAAAPLGTGLVGVFGGYGPGDTRLATNEVYNYDTNTWATKAPMPTGRSRLSAASLGSGIAGTWGGESSSGSVNVNEVYAY